MSPSIADRLEHRLAAESGQHQVEHDEVDGASASTASIAARPSPTTRHRMAVALEVEPQQLAEARLVLDDQDPGACAGMGAS